MGGSSLPGRLLAGNITSETFLKRIGEMFSLGGWNGSNRHAAPPRAEIASSRTKLRCISDTRQSILGAHKDITRMVQEYGAGAVLLDRGFVSRSYLFLFLLFFIFYLFFFLPFLVCRAHRKACMLEARVTSACKSLPRPYQLFFLMPS